MAEFERQDTAHKVLAIIAKKLSIKPDSISEHATLQDLGADSLAMVDIIMQLEEDFNIEINDEKAESLKNVGDVIDYVHQLRT